jgi:hypothetical protein
VLGRIPVLVDSQYRSHRATVHASTAGSSPVRSNSASRAATASRRVR